MLKVQEVRKKCYRDYVLSRSLLNVIFTTLKDLQVQGTEKNSRIKWDCVFARVRPNEILLYFVENINRLLIEF